MNTSFLRELIRTPETFVPEHPTRKDLAHTLPRMLGVIVCSAAVVGAVLGSYRGGEQVLYSAIKLPAVFLLPTLFGATAVHALAVQADEGATWARTGLAAITGSARSAIMILATVPLLWMWLGISGVAHEAAVLSVAAVFVVAGLPGMAAIAGLSNRSERSQVVGVLILMGALVAQSSWLVRPLVGHRDAPIAFSAPIDRHIVKGLANPGGR